MKKGANLRGTLSKTKFLAPALYTVCNCWKYRSMIFPNNNVSLAVQYEFPTSLTPIQTPTSVLAALHGAYDGWVAMLELN